MIRSPGKALLAIAVSLLVLIVAAGAYRFYRRLTDTSAVQETDGRILSRVVFATMAKANELRVMRLDGNVQGVASDDGAGGVLHSTLVVRSPFRVSYFVDLRRLGRSQFRWNERDRVLTVVVPDIRVERPDIDEGRAEVVRTTGLFLTRGAMNRLRQRAAGAAGKVAWEEAVKPARLQAAQANARSAIAELFAAPLRAARIDATVKVRFAHEGGTEQMDRSRSLEEIYANPAA